jgi:TatD DNase family protein
MLIDSHCHLDYYDDGEIDAVVARARAAGVGQMLTISTKISEFPRLLAIALAREGVFCTVGVHPHEAANETDATAEKLIELARHPKVVGIGETGLDYHYRHSPPAEQRAMFRAHIHAARACAVPLIVHARDADTEMAEILRDEMGQGAFSGVMHCFSSSMALAEAALELGFYISFSGIITFKNADDVRAVASMVPLDRLLVETDAPYLAPAPHRGKRNEPSLLPATAAKLAELRGIDAATLNDHTSRNFQALFAKTATCA